MTNGIYNMRAAGSYCYFQKANFESTGLSSLLRQEIWTGQPESTKLKGYIVPAIVKSIHHAKQFYR